MPRRADHPVTEVFLERWSPRAMSGDPLKLSELLRLFEAARWAPSSANGQPWRFCFALAGTPDFERFFELLAEGNKRWCRKAGALVVIASKTTRRGKPARTHSFDTGAAWMSFALQGSIQGLVVHGMEGFDYERAARELELPPEHAIEAMAAVGRPGRLEDLPEDYQVREVPSLREPVTSFVYEGRFGG